MFDSLLDCACFNMKRAREDVNEELQCKNSKSSTDQSLRKISINTRLAANILLLEANKGCLGKNVVCSPLSLEFALHMVAAGSKGKTLSQMLKFIGSKNYPLESMEDLNLKSLGIMKFASSFCKSEDKSELSFANGVWVDSQYKLKPSYKELMSSIYNARAENVHFESEGDRIAEDINSWVTDKTKGVIKEIMAPGSISPLTSLILVNTLYFKGFWSKSCSFDEDMTVDKDFHLLNGSKVSVPFMSRSSPTYLYGSFNGFRVVQVDYTSEDNELRQVCMQIFLPNTKAGLQNLINKCMSDPSLLHQDHRLNYEDFKELRIPKFKFTYRPQNIVDIMKSLGLTQPFDQDCKDFTEIVKLSIGKTIYVSNIIHKATIEVSETKTVAAAATAVEMIASGSSMGWQPPPPPTLRFVADHPFMFVIKEVNSGAILFMGAVFNPLLED